VFYGGAIIGALGFALMARVHRLPLAAALDALLPALPIGHALGRIGCYLGGCCYGAAWSGPWAITYLSPLAPAAHPSLPRHPWPLYEALVLIALAIVFERKPREWRPGRASAWYVLVYAIARFALEPLRGDVIRGIDWAFMLSTSQLISIVLAFGASAVLATPRASMTMAPGSRLRTSGSSAERDLGPEARRFERRAGSRTRSPKPGVRSPL